MAYPSGHPYDPLSDRYARGQPERKPNPLSYLSSALLPLPLLLPRPSLFTGLLLLRLIEPNVALVKCWLRCRRLKVLRTNYMDVIMEYDTHQKIRLPSLPKASTS